MSGSLTAVVAWFGQAAVGYDTFVAGEKPVAPARRPAAEQEKH